MKQIEDAKSANDSLPNPNLAIAAKPDRSRAIALAAMCLALFMTNFDGTSTDVALPQIQRSLGANVADIQWILNAYHLPVASLLLATGKFGDLYGLRRIFIYGLIIFTVASAICGLAPNLEILIFGRAFQGIGAAALIPLSLTIVTAIYPDPEERTKAIGIWSAVSALAMLAGPGLGGLFVDVLGWQSIFLFNIPLGVITLIMTFRGYKEDRYAIAQHLDVFGLLLSIVTIASLTWALTDGSNGAWLSPHTIGLLGVGGFSFLGFWLVESRSTHPIIPLPLLRNQTFAVIIITQTLVFFTSGGLFFILSIFLQNVRGYSAVTTGMCFLPMNGAIIIAAFASGWVAARLGWRFPIISGLVIASIATLALTRISVDTEYGEILWYLMLSGFGGGLTVAPLASGAMNSVLPIQEGIASAISSISIQFGGILGIAIQGTILSQRLDSVLRQSLSEWKLPSVLQDKIAAEPLQYLTQISQDIPSTISTLALQQEIRNGFVLGLHTTLFVACLTLLLGIVLMLVLLPSKLKQRSQF
ncbi:MAG: MFS transporter [Calothrix sp. MO_167.B42]|nr:MFS transporter [Calothrix sp. MO_167.B42]